MNELLLFMKDKWGKSRSLKERQRDSNRIINHVYCILKVNDKQTHVSFCEIRCSTQCQSILLLLNVVKCIRCFSCEMYIAHEQLEQLTDDPLDILSPLFHRQHLLI